MSKKKDDNNKGRDGNYEVGYGKPPKHSRFKPGRSGNPKGRPKASKNMATILEERLSQFITVRQDGRVRRVPLREALVQKIVYAGVHGPLKDQMMVLAAIEKYAPNLIECEYPKTITVRFVESDGNGRPKGFNSAEEYFEALHSGKLDEAPEKQEAEQDDDDDSWLDGK